MKIFGSLVLLSVVLSVCGAYRILGVFPRITKSHFIVFESLMKTLAKRGHQVDVVSHYPRKNPLKNYNDVISFRELEGNLTDNHSVESASKLTAEFVNRVGNTYGNRICQFMGHEKFQKLVKTPPNDPPYDAVIVQANGAHCYMGLGHVLKVPVIAVTTAPEFPWINHFSGNAENLAVFPHIFFTPSGTRMSFWERLTNVYTYLKLVNKFHAITGDNQTAAMRKFLSPDIPHVREVEKNLSLLLVNTHPVINGVKPVTPSLVQIAGLHIEANEDELSPGLKKWMDESKHGVVYFSLGSIVIIESLPREKLQVLYSSFEKISPVRVLMRIADSTRLPPGLPGNVKTMPWIPQQPVLKHPNTKIFITHGGLGSTLEAFYFGIPMIGIPLDFDQFANIVSLENKGIAVKVTLDELSEKTLVSALKAILTNPDYKKNADRYSKLFRDNPTSQSDKAVFWIEYVIRNGGDSLKSPALQFDWYQLLLLDVYVFVTVAILLVLSVVILTVRLVVKKLGKSSVKAKRTSKFKKMQ